MWAETTTEKVRFMTCKFTTSGNLILMFNQSVQLVGDLIFNWDPFHQNELILFRLLPYAYNVQWCQNGLGCSFLKYVFFLSYRRWSLVQSSLDIFFLIKQVSRRNFWKVSFLVFLKGLLTLCKCQVLGFGSFANQASVTQTGDASPLIIINLSLLFFWASGLRVNARRTFLCVEKAEVEMSPFASLIHAFFLFQ